MFKFLHQESKTVTAAAIVLALLSFLSRLAGLVRDRILAGTFGAGDVLDIYYTAFKIPDLLFSLLVIGALSAGFIPLFSHFWNKRSPGTDSDAWRFTNSVLHLVVLTFATFSILAFVLAPFLSALLAPGFSASKLAAVTHFLRLFLFAQLLLSISMVFGSVLQGLKRFMLYALAPIVYNIGIIVGAVFFVPVMGTTGLAWGVILGALFHALTQVYGVFQAGYRYKWILTWNKDIQEMMRLTAPRLMSLGIGQLGFIIMTMVASHLLLGSVTILNFAYNIQYFPVGIIGISYAVAVFPVLCEAARKENYSDFQRLISHTIRAILFLIVPCMIIFLLLRAQLVRLAVGAEGFDWQSTILTADTLAFFALSFVPQAIIFVLLRAYFALHDTLTPLVIGIVCLVLQGIGNLYFTQQFGVAGLGISFSLSSMLQLALLWVPLRTRIGSLDEGRILSSLFIISTAGILSGLAVQFLKPLSLSLLSLQTFFGVLFQVALAGGGGVIVYGLITWKLKSPEMSDFIAVCQRRIFKKFTPHESIPSEPPSGS